MSIEFQLRWQNCWWSGPYTCDINDDVIKWKHFPRYWPFVRGIHPSPVNSPHKGHAVTRSLDIFLCLHVNKQLSKQSRRRWIRTSSHPLWRHCNVMGNGFHGISSFSIWVIYIACPNNALSLTCLWSFKQTLATTLQAAKWFMHEPLSLTVIYDIVELFSWETLTRVMISCLLMAVKLQNLAQSLSSAITSDIWYATIHSTRDHHDDALKWKHFRVTGPLCGEFTGHRWIPFTKASDAELWCFLWSAPEQTVEQTIETSFIWDVIGFIMTSP